MEIDETFRLCLIEYLFRAETTLGHDISSSIGRPELGLEGAVAVRMTMSTGVAPSSR